MLRYSERWLDALLLRRGLLPRSDAESNKDREEKQERTPADIRPIKRAERQDEEGCDGRESKRRTKSSNGGALHRASFRRGGGVSWGEMGPAVFRTQKVGPSKPRGETFLCSERVDGGPDFVPCVGTQVLGLGQEATPLRL